MIFEWSCPIELALDVEYKLLKLGWRVHAIGITLFGHVCFLASYDVADWN